MFLRRRCSTALRVPRIDPKNISARDPAFLSFPLNAAQYTVSRPTYPWALFETILNYHEKSLALPSANTEWSPGVDLSCGTG
ncbi:hypothetical protein FB451DRAFT_1553471 [Mycena latifolia]|nr:hypothetical protein FB451DRAFT_1553471 [Mycena latifolia]